MDKETIKKLLDDGVITAGQAAQYFPELEERIREELIEQVVYIVPNDDEVDNEGNVLPTYQKRIDKYRAWLEKQDEQKPANWHKELEDKLANTTPQQLAEWKEKYFKEESAEWSKEDEKILSDIIKDLVHPWNEYIPDRIENEIKWLKNRLKSLRPQNHWNPSDEQMDALQYVCKNINPPLSDKLGWDSLRTLKLMYQDLKKLREE